MAKNRPEGKCYFSPLPLTPASPEIFRPRWHIAWPAPFPFCVSLLNALSTLLTTPAMSAPSETPRPTGTDSFERDEFRQQYPGPYAEGSAAFKDGLSLSDNPYATDTGEHDAWDVGYDDAQTG